MRIISTIQILAPFADTILEFPANSRTISLMSGSNIPVWPNGLKIETLVANFESYGATPLSFPEASETTLPNVSYAKGEFDKSSLNASGAVTAEHYFGQVAKFDQLDLGFVCYTHQINLEGSISTSDISLEQGGQIFQDGVLVGQIRNVIIPTGTESVLGTYDYRALAVGHALEVFGETINEA